MKPVRLALLLALAAPAAAQQVYFQHLPNIDSATVILTGDTGSVRLAVYTNCAGLSAYTIRLYFDSDRLTVVEADSVPGYGFLKPTRTDGTDYVDLTATGSYTGCTAYVATVRFLLDAGAAQGSLLSLRALTLTGNAGGDLLPNHETFLGQVCQAVDLWGDTDGSRTVTSRDALVLLTAAVGLPTPGFSLLSGDVDGDGYITTRDALFALSRAVGMTANRAGRARTNRCAPLAPAPADAAFYSNGKLWRIAAGDSVPLLVGFSPAGGYRPTWAPDGSRILFTQFVSGYGLKLISVTPDGGTADTLFAASSSNDLSPSWSPDGASIAFASNRLAPSGSLWVMNANGTNPVQLTFDSLVVYETAWTPDGFEIVFTAYSNVACCARRLWAVQPNGQGLRELTPAAGLSPVDPTVSPAGDSVAFRNASADMLVMDLGGVGAPVRAARLYGSQYWPQWVTAGRAFRGDIVYPYGFYLERPDGRILRWARGDAYSYEYLRLRTP